ncbi:aflatoxin B1 aldehyde reductase member 2 [Nannizzia gypsea CBS 118893]|uniref:Aflatoxin B1 aldehyde reductase member 2 n=1 Tax=Arthroderma gypseum (strain ATCC MYA-4604 / CBS 118893) TaxID=535722 RepID=E4UUW4_ARTGP|nr:aflatoxin B1 aldehyde reductase member 2 [Nannizzia gypsea CBS 118893]EFR01081.1 aflatoxin B1 aldehyde reductase member 2 [Nannizzia gypsea CBS 118893]
MSVSAQPPKRRVILGLMTFGTDASVGARVTSLDEFNKCLSLFHSYGHGELDTARVYCRGSQEAFTAKTRFQELGLSIATKVYPNNVGDHKPEALRETFKKSLLELQVGSVDVFYLHAADRTTPFAETLAECDKLHREGLFQRLGLSNFAAFEVAEIVRLCRENGWVSPSIYQGKYNALHRSLEKELIPACRRYGIDVVVYNPLAAGLFSGKYKNAEVPNEGRFSGPENSLGSLYRARYFKDATFEALRIIEPAATKHGLSLLEVAFRWIVHHSALNISDGGRDGVVIGVASCEQLEGNLKDLEKGPLPHEVIEALDAAWAVTAATEANYWHGKLEYAYS